jgi:BirA family biotin operon repressor/biotin-[acetyl-CoA-carboxylase] ligase
LARVEHHPTLTSTNDHARVAAAEPGELPLLVIADEQTAGRGRGANRWWTGAGSLACSLLFDPAAGGIERRYFSMISLAAAVSIVEAAAPVLAHQPIGVHWPNDVFAGGRKLAGILVEALPDGKHIVGIGCNVNNSLAEAPAELQAIVASLVDLTGQRRHRTAFLLELLERLQANLRLLASSPESLGERAHELCLQRGSRLTLQAGKGLTTGVCAGIAPDGALLLETPAGLETHYSGVLVHDAER